VRIAVVMSAILAATLASAGCERRTAWTKEGVTASELRRDRLECTADAKSYDFLNGPPGANSSGPGATRSPMLSARQEGDIYQACMVGKGYDMGGAAAEEKAKPQP
jgi:hypothetical protein